MTMTHQRLAAALSAGVLTLTLAACGSDEPDPSESEDEESNGQDSEADGADEGEDEDSGDPEVSSGADWHVMLDGEDFEIDSRAQVLCFPASADTIQLGIVHTPDLSADEEERNAAVDQSMYAMLSDADPPEIEYVSVGDAYSGGDSVTYDSTLSTFDDPAIEVNVELIDDQTYHIAGVSVNPLDMIGGTTEGEEVIVEDFLIPFEVTITCQDDFRDMPPLDEGIDVDFDEFDFDDEDLDEDDFDF